MMMDRGPQNNPQNTRRIDKYEMLERLGHGGAAEVWKALDTQLQRFVALKLLKPNLRDDPNFVTRFQREAQLIASLHHPNIVQIHDFQFYQPSPNSAVQAPVDITGPGAFAYMVMEYVEGQTLADYIHHTSYQGRIPSPVELVNLFTSISLAIDYAHHKGMIHRDIKPANILLDRRSTMRNPMGEPILTDFGVARLLSTSSNSISGAQLGTPLYISPEQAKGYPGNERSDLYSLGVILYEMVTGVLPFRGDTPLDVITQHMNVMPTAPSLINPTISPTLALVIMRSLAKDPSARFSSAAAMTASLAEALNVPVPELLGQPTFPLDAPDMPTHHGALTQGSTPVVPATPVAMGGSGEVQKTPYFTPMYPSLQQSSPRQSAPPPAGPPPTPLAQPPVQKTRPKWPYIALATLLIAVILASGWGIVRAIPTIFATPTPVGHAFYVSSGQLNPNTAQGIADQMQIDLQNVPNPQPGKSYFAWLLGDRNPNTTDDLTGPRPVQPPILLTNNLPVSNGAVHYFYQGDKQHNNLISATSRLLITEQDTNSPTSTPPTDRALWRYYATLPETAIPLDPAHFSALVHIRHLFYNEVDIKVLGLPGGLDIWLFRNTEKLLEWSVSARDNWHGDATSAGDIRLMSDQFIRILNYLDGVPNMQVDVPAGTPILADPVASKVALLTIDTQQGGKNLPTNPPGYIDHTQLHVGQVSKAIDISPETRGHAAHIIDGLKNANTHLQNVRRDAIQLFNMRSNPDQLRQPAAGALLDDLVSQATYAYIGQLNPVTNQVQPGVLQVHHEIQLLGAYTITANLPDRL